VAGPIPLKLSRKAFKASFLKPSRGGKQASRSDLSSGRVVGIVAREATKLQDCGDTSSSASDNSGD
jgi:hypothetical protein